MRKRIPHPVRGAYDYADPDKPCPNCHAEPFQWCRNPETGHDRHTPCVARLVKRPDSEGPDKPPPVIVRPMRNYDEPVHLNEETDE